MSAESMSPSSGARQAAPSSPNDGDTVPFSAGGPDAAPSTSVVSPALAAEADGAAASRACGPVPGDTLGGYRLVREIGRGGMGTVYLAAHTWIDRKAAVKVLLPQFSSDPLLRERFFAEARETSLVKHPGIVEIFDCNVHSSGSLFIVMEYLEGESLGAALGRVRDFSGDPACLVDIGRQVASAMAAAHECGIVHRDLKPDNIFLTSRPERCSSPWVKILDFGIAKLLTPAISTTPTQTGRIVGTPQYMSPEQFRAQGDLGAASDVYSLGCVLFEMACGVPPFVRANSAELMVAHLTQPPPRLSALQPRVRPELDELVWEMLAKEPERRPSGMREVEARLGELGPTLRAATVLYAPPGAACDGRTEIFEPEGAARVSCAPGAAVERQEPDRRADALAGRDAEAGRGAEEQPAARARAAGPRRGRKLLAAAAAIPLVLAAVLVSLRRPSPPPADAAPPAAPDDPAPPPGMVHLSGASFLMGSSEDEIAAASGWCRARGIPCRPALLEREKPRRLVTLPGFFLDATEVTNEQFLAWLETRSFPVQDGRFVRDAQGRLVLDLHAAQGGIGPGGSRYSLVAGSARKPVVQVTWLGARLYCLDQGKRLPSEAEWELAARGTARRAFPWGSQDDLPRCGDTIFGGAPGAGCPGVRGPAEVGSAPQDATPDGVRDLGGNVAEWVADAFAAPYPDCGPACLAPQVEVAAPGPSPATRVIRGGSWALGADACRGAGRSRRAEDAAQSDVGFRCARSVSTP